MGRLFGTDGIRGIANEGLTPELAFDLGRAVAHVLTSDYENPVISIFYEDKLLCFLTSLEDKLSFT